MKNTKTKIILSVSILVSVIGFVGIVIAAGSSLYVSPASLTKAVGNTFNVSVGVNTSGNKVCAAEGTLVFNNLSCQSITVAGDVMSQSSPTCSNPYFLIGVPNCTTVDKVLFTMSVKTENAGTASINLTGVDVIGEGTSVGSASISGNYTINIVSTPTPSPTPSTPLTPEEPEVLTPEEPIIPVPEVVIEEEQGVEEQSLLASIGNLVSFGTGSVPIGIIVSIIVLLIIFFIIKGIRLRKSK